MTGRVAVTHQEYVDSFAAEKYILGELPVAERDNFEEHYFECAECADAVRHLSDLKIGTQAGLCPPVEARAPKLHWMTTWLKSWRLFWMQPQGALAGALAAVSLVGVLGYQNVELRNQLRPRMVQSVLLPPATRGELPTVRAQAAGDFILLEADVPSASGQLTWAVRSKDGDTLFEGLGAAPEPGLTLKVLLPAEQIEPGEYSLLVKSDTGNEWMFQFRSSARSDIK